MSNFKNNNNKNNNNNNAKLSVPVKNMIKSLVGNITKGLTISAQTNRTARRIMANRRRNIRRNVFNRQRRAIPAARTNNFNKRFYVDQLTATSARVSGSDLVYAIPDNLTTGNSTNVITVIPCNPAYWLGTRVSAIASGYQNYRPIKFEVNYVPQVAVTQQGNVIGGTMWFDAPPLTNLQQTLRTSNGGMMTQCYKPARSTVKLQTNLQYNLYRMGGNIDQQSMPFYYVAIAVACKSSENVQITPGYFYVNYSFIFKNPTGPSTVYYNSGLTSFDGQTSKIRTNSIAILCSALSTELATLDVGTILDIEYEPFTDVYEFIHNGTKVDPPLGKIWILSNGPNQPLNSLQKKLSTKMPIHYNTKGTASGLISIPPQWGVIYKDTTISNYYSIALNQGNSLISFNIGEVVKEIYMTSELGQNFGTLSNILGNLLEFLAPIDEYYTLMVNTPGKAKEDMNKLKELQQKEENDKSDIISEEINTEKRD